MLNYQRVCEIHKKIMGKYGKIIGTYMGNE